MDAFFEKVFTAGPPSLDLQGRPGTLQENAVRAAVASAGGGFPIAAERLRLLEGIALLWHDRWDQAHTIAQAREGAPDFDLLHAMLHRREGDFGNAGYWFRSAGKHPCYARLERRLADPALGLQALLPKSGFTPEAFLERVRLGLRAGAAAEKEILIRAQAEEFRAFAEWSLASPPSPR